MADPAERLPQSTAPPADPAAIRACLSAETAVVFDEEWEFVLDEAKGSKSLVGIHELLHKWRFFAHEERTQPGWYGALVAKADEILRTGVNPGAVSGDDMRALIARRLAE